MVKGKNNLRTPLGTNKGVVSTIPVKSSGLFSTSFTNNPTHNMSRDKGPRDNQNTSTMDRKSTKRAHFLKNNLSTTMGGGRDTEVTVDHPKPNKVSFPKLNRDLKPLAILQQRFPGIRLSRPWPRGPQNAIDHSLCILGHA
jgi:hypothetical protein